MCIQFNNPFGASTGSRALRLQTRRAYVNSGSRREVSMGYRAPNVELLVEEMIEALQKCVVILRDAGEVFWLAEFENAIFKARTDPRIVNGVRHWSAGAGSL